MKLLQYLIVSLLLSWCSTSAFSQESQVSLTEEQRAALKEQMMDYAKALDLSEAQQPKFRAINQTFFEGLQSLKNSDSPRFKKYRKYKSLNKDRKKEMKSLLNKDQYDLYKKQQEEIEQKMRSMMKDR